MGQLQEFWELSEPVHWIRLDTDVVFGDSFQHICGLLFRANEGAFNFDVAEHKLVKWYHDLRRLQERGSVEVLGHNRPVSKCSHT